jgi:A/G-specific adenine glycosylase
MSNNKEMLDAFVQKVWDFYRANKRNFPWRDTPTPYNVFVSEIMLQQTQTNRSIEKFHEFITAFPTFKALADAPFVEVLRVWKGLGYNRRALWIQKSAQIICQDYQGHVPQTPEELEKLPGIGPATARSITAFAWNTPTIFIETNVRSVFLHEFFNNIPDVHDKELLPLIEKTVNHTNPREWYYALMDYGVFLKKTYKNPSRKSKHHVKQSKFEGSDRQIRGRILEQLLALGKCSREELCELCACEPERLGRIAQELIDEKLIQEGVKNNLIIAKKHS